MFLFYKLRHSSCVDARMNNITVTILFMHIEAKAIFFPEAHGWMTYFFSMEF